MVKILAIAPLMRLSGFYDIPIRLTMEDAVAILRWAVAAIAIEDLDLLIKGQMDILALNQA